MDSQTLSVIIAVAPKEPVRTPNVDRSGPADLGFLVCALVLVGALVAWITSEL